MTTPFLLLQLADGTFPSGGFAHSAGLEASAELGGLGAHDATDALDAFVDDAIVQATHATLPFVRAACLDPSHLAELDDAFDATVPLDVPNRASRALGRALASAFGRVFDAPAIAVITAHTRRAPAHHAPVFGALYGALAIDPEEAALRIATLIDGLSVQVTLGDTAVSEERMREICLDFAALQLGAELGAAGEVAGSERAVV